MLTRASLSGAGQRAPRRCATSSNPARTASRQSPDMPIESVLPPMRANVLAASSKAREISSRSAVERPDGHHAVEAQARLLAERLGEALGLGRRAAEALGRRNVELKQDRQAPCRVAAPPSRARRRPRPGRRSAPRRRGRAIAFALFVWRWPTKCLRTGGSAANLRRRFLHDSSRRCRSGRRAIAAATMPRRADLCRCPTSVTLRRLAAAARGAPRRSRAAAPGSVRAAPSVIHGPARRRPGRASVREPGRVAQYATPMMPIDDHRQRVELAAGEAHAR